MSKNFLSQATDKNKQKKSTFLIDSSLARHFYWRNMSSTASLLKLKPIHTKFYASLHYMLVLYEVI